MLNISQWNLLFVMAEHGALCCDYWYFTRTVCAFTCFINYVVFQLLLLACLKYLLNHLQLCSFLERQQKPTSCSLDGISPALCVADRLRPHAVIFK